MHVHRGQVDLTTDSDTISDRKKGKLRQHAPELHMHEKDKRRYHERELLEVMHVQRGQADLASVRAGMALVTAYAEPLQNRVGQDMPKDHAAAQAVAQPQAKAAGSGRQPKPQAQAEGPGRWPRP